MHWPTWWLQMSWGQTGTRTSATTMLIAKNLLREWCVIMFCLINTCMVQMILHHFSIISSLYFLHLLIKYFNTPCCIFLSSPLKGRCLSTHNHLSTHHSHNPSILHLLVHSLMHSLTNSPTHSPPLTLHPTYTLHSLYSSPLSSHLLAHSCTHSPTHPPSLTLPPSPFPPTHPPSLLRSLPPSSLARSLPRSFWLIFICVLWCSLESNFIMNTHKLNL